MHIRALIKQVPDPEGPPDSYFINNELHRVEPKGIPPVIGVFDENAIEAALKLKDKNSDIKITLLSVGKKLSNAVLQKGLAVGADELIKVEDDKLDASVLDSYKTASAIVGAVKKIGEYDLIIAGRQSADWNAGQTGVFVSEMLGIPAVTLAKKLDIEGDKIISETTLPSGYEVVKTGLPALVIASSDIGELRYPTVPQRREAKKKPVIEWNAESIDFDDTIEARLELTGLYQPEMRQSDCVMVEGETPEQAGRNLAARLREDGIL